MRAFIGMTKRNMLVYFKDRMAVLFSILTPVLIFVLYILFLRKTFVSSLAASMADVKDYIDSKDVDAFANLILLAGVIASSSITVSYSSLSTIVSDRENRIDYDISATPLYRITIILSYMTAGFLTSLIVTSALLSIGLFIVSLIGPTYLGFTDVLALYGITSLGSLSSTALFMIFMCIFKTSSQSGAFQGLLCAGAGFVIGAYIPISEFASPIQTIANLFPGSHIAALLRRYLLDGVINHMDSFIGGVDNGAFKVAVKEAFSLNLSMFNTSCSTLFSFLYPVFILIFSILISGILYNKIYKRK